jgi:DNA-binding transcriptional regulator YbjK
LAIASVAALLLQLSLSAADEQSAEPVASAQRAALLEAAQKTYQATTAAYSAGVVRDIGQLYAWSRRWMEAESLDPTPEVRRKAAQEHLARMEAQLVKVAALHQMALKGGESHVFHAMEYYVAEAKLMLAQLDPTE